MCSEDTRKGSGRYAEGPGLVTYVNVYIETADHSGPVFKGKAAGDAAAHMQTCHDRYWEGRLLGCFRAMF